MGIRFFIDLPNGETIMRRDTDRGVDYRGKKAGTFLYVDGTWIKGQPHRSLQEQPQPTRVRRALRARQGSDFQLRVLLRRRKTTARVASRSNARRHNGCLRLHRLACPHGLV
jgi:hypothetical protein